MRAWWVIATVSGGAATAYALLWPSRSSGLVAVTVGLAVLALVVHRMRRARSRFKALKSMVLLDLVLGVGLVSVLAQRVLDPEPRFEDPVAAFGVMGMLLVLLPLTAVVAIVTVVAGRTGSPSRQEADPR